MTPTSPRISAALLAATVLSVPLAVDPDRITIAVILARMTEFFDFFIYAIASALVFPHVFFSFVDPLTATLYSFAVFSLAFIARPIGSLIFLQIDRKFGRAVKLMAALFRQDGFEHVTKFRLVQPRHILAQEKQVAVSDRRPDHRQKIRTNGPVFGVDIGRCLCRPQLFGRDKIVVTVCHLASSCIQMPQCTNAQAEWR